MVYSIEIGISHKWGIPFQLFKCGSISHLETNPNHLHRNIAGETGRCLPSGNLT